MTLRIIAIFLGWAALVLTVLSLFLLLYPIMGYGEQSKAVGALIRIEATRLDTDPAEPVYKDLRHILARQVTDQKMTTWVLAWGILTFVVVLSAAVAWMGSVQLQILQLSRILRDRNRGPG